MSRTSLGIALLVGFLALIQNAHAADSSGLSATMIGHRDDAAETVFQRIVKKAAEDPSHCLVYYIVTDEKTDSAYWVTYSEMALLKSQLDEKAQLKPADLLFIIQEYSKPYIIKNKDDAKRLFNTLIIERLGKQAQDSNLTPYHDITRLLTEVSINQPEAWSTPWSNPVPKEARNVIAECVAQGYKEALGAIITAWPTFLLDLHALPAVTFTEQVADLGASGLRTVYKDGPQTSKNIIQWLMRENGSPFTYMAGYYKKEEYISAASSIMTFVASRHNIKITGEVLGMAALLEREKELPSGFSMKKFIARVNDPALVNGQGMPVDQEQAIKQMITSKQFQK